MNRNTLCPIPWMHLNFEPDGKVIPCCLTSSSAYHVGDLSTDSIDQIWNSDKMKSLRKQMISGEEPAICKKCFKKERATGDSSRKFHLRWASNLVEKIPEITKEDGTCTEMNLLYWDFRFSNLCNFKCRSCGPRYSSAWVPDGEKLYGKTQDKVWNIASVNQGTNYDWIHQQIDKVQKIYFAGGEPLMMPEHWQILELLNEKKKFDVSVSYNTNLSVLSYNKKNALDYWQNWNFNKLHLMPSIDEVGIRAELLRSGTVWEKVEKNLQTVSAMPNLVVNVAMTIGAWNVWRIPEIIEHLVEIGVIKDCKIPWYNKSNFYINLLEGPTFYHVSVLPDNFRADVTKKLQKFIETYRSKHGIDLSNRFQYILHELNKPWNKSGALQFISMTSRVDKIRNENLYEVIPEMSVILDAVKNLKS